MKPILFSIRNYKCIKDSGWVEIEPLTVLVGKNESGKTSILKAIHKFNSKDEKYNIENEWPRGDRKNRNFENPVCTIRFELNEIEIEELKNISNNEISSKTVDVFKDYEGRFEIKFEHDIFSDKLHPNDIDDICKSFPKVKDPVGENFKKILDNINKEIKTSALEGKYNRIKKLEIEFMESLNQNRSDVQLQQHHKNEQNYINQFKDNLTRIEKILNDTPSIQKKVHEYIVNKIPTFIYMSDYRIFSGTALLDQIKQRKDKRQLTEEDKTFIMILELSGLTFDEEIEKIKSSDKEQRQYDLDDASATLTNEISERWSQRKYEVEFRGDGHHFFTFVKDNRDISLIKLEERSKGFQWFFSFDLLFMYESKGKFENCVILLDEPGLHLHPGAQRDLLKRLEAYAKNNILIYSTHLPFMIDLQRPERIRILDETDKGVVITEELIKAQPDAKFVLQAALGMEGRSSYLLSTKNLIVEGVDDYWIISELSRIMEKSGKEGFLEDIFITPAGGSSQAVYITTLMIGQGLDVFCLLDGDKAGQEAKDKLVKNWLLYYKDKSIHAKLLGEILDSDNVKKIISIEDIFPEKYYLEKVKEIYSKNLGMNGFNDEIKLTGNDNIVKKVNRFLKDFNIEFNHGLVAKKIRKDLKHINTVEELIDKVDEDIVDIFLKLVNNINTAFN